jgi:hypothetical protein
MVFSCTKKILDKIKKQKVIEDNKVEIDFYNWYVDLINLERKNYFLFTNSKTLFSFFLYAGTKKKIDNLEEIFEEKLKEQIIRQIGTNQNYLNSLFSTPKEYRFVKTNSRSVLGSMNDFKFQIKVQIQHKGELKHTYNLINHLINQVPMGGLKYKQPVRAMENELKLLIK